MSPGILLRDVVPGDLPILFEHQRDPDSVAMAALPARDWEAFTAHWARILTNEAVAKKTIVFDGLVAGYLLGFNRSDKREVGYWIGKELWGKGIATKALLAFLAHETARPLYAHVAKHNVGSVRVLQKCGFTVEGEELGGADANGQKVQDYVMKLA